MTKQKPNPVRPESGDYINLGKLSPLTLEGLRRLSNKASWPEIYDLMQPEAVLLLIERLKACRDDEDIFPHGKWATIQRLQAIWDEDFWLASEARV